MPSNIRVRFAPSPTGFVHVGGLRTALYNFLFARKHGGTFILRIEDTDRTRYVEGALENLIGTLLWSGLEYDEGPNNQGSYRPYIQSQRLKIYREHVEQLLQNGKAYRCFCTPERLDAMRREQEKRKVPPKYDRMCLRLRPDQVQENLKNKIPFAVRMKVPGVTKIRFHDIIREDVEFLSDRLDDQVLLKSDGYPTYHLANVVDDHLMEISHVIRGEEWLSSTPKHIILYQFFGWQPPQFAHLPLLLNPDKTKLSKRQGDVAVEEYRAKGYLREGLLNFIALLGWNPGDEREIFSLDELIREFSLERVGKAGAVFNLEKLNWINQQHIRRKSNEELAEMLKPILKQKGYQISQDGYLLDVIALMKERVTVLHDFVTIGSYFFQDPETYDGKALKKHWTPETSSHLNDAAKQLSARQEFDERSIEQVIRAFAKEFKLNASDLIHPLRLALTGVSVGPGLFELMSVLGKETVLRRIQKAIAAIKK